MRGLNQKRKLASKSGFTLVEVAVSIIIFSLAIAGIMRFFIHGWNFTHYNSGKLSVNRDIRSFTTELSDNATFSNFPIIYDSFTNRVQRDDGTSGDFLVLVYRDPTNTELTERIVGYYRSGTASTEGPVRKFDIPISPASNADIATLLPAASTINSHEEVIEVSKGLANGQLFYNYLNRSIIVRGEIIHEGSASKKATNTYNFTISPRG